MENQNERKFYKELKISKGKAIYEYYEIKNDVCYSMAKCEKILINTEIVAVDDPKNDKATGIKKTYKLKRKPRWTQLMTLTMYRNLHSQPVTFINGEPTIYDITKDNN